ncbi:ankyrin repeat-containing domain protein [Aspergillus alliaceus]|uniref:Ankyrin repeat-containing domain protein n=1 Tax=Petromyces alliaceus TaxID=209559 RepID=A0A5N7BRT3_PETAA|nr:ankyrin repeat-containing domain protein [Aspergillus alliaceus]
MAPMSSDPTEAKERRREQNRLAQRRFRRNLSSGYESQGTQPGDAVLPDTPGLVSMNPIGGPPDGHHRSLYEVNADLFLDGGEFSSMNNLPASDLDMIPAINGLQPTPAPSEPAMEISNPFTCNESSIPSEINNSSSEATTCKPASNNFGGSRASPLHRAVQMGHSKIVRLLLEHNANCNERDSDGLTPLIHAIIGGYEDMVDMLLSHGANIGLVDDEHRSALHWAVIWRRDRLLTRVLKHCVGNSTLVNQCTKDGRTPLLIAIDTGFEAAVEVLLESGADV